jgi:methionyl-tRNA formyltransferase
MKITFLINHDLASTLALNILLPKLEEHELCLFYTQKANVASSIEPLVELSEFEKKLLENERSSRSNKPLLSIEKLGDIYCKTCARANEINSNDFDIIQSTAPDLIVSIRHMTIMRERIISLPKFGVINLHSGLLPQYQGVMATFWAMLNQEPDIGTSLHYISDSNIDTGNILRCSPVKCDYQKSYLYNVLRLYKPGAESILTTINSIAKKEVPSARKQIGATSYYSFPTLLDLAKFKDEGRQLFDERDTKPYVNLLRNL